MINRWSAPPLRVSGIYLLVGLTYIIVSDLIVESGWDRNDWVLGIQTIKGLIFVLLSAILIHFLIYREMTRRQALELKLMRAQRMEAVGQLTNGVAHDFNNFLTVIIGNLEMIQEDIGCTATLGKRADQALFAADRAADLTRRLLAFSRKQFLEPRQIDVNDCVAQMKMLLGSVLGEEITVVTDLAPDRPMIVADPGQLETALLNLALNSRDAMPSGGTIMLTTCAVEFDSDQTFGKWSVKKGNYVRITVTDEGVGMTPEVQDKLVEPFFTTKRVGQGTGLGFPMSHVFVKASGGHVVVRSKNGSGTSVMLYFPLSVPAPVERVATVSSRPAPERRGNETILLVENDIPVRDTLDTFMTDLGYRVLLASRAKEAEDLLARGTQVDLLMLDTVLGGRRGGIELANELRRTHADIPMLIISGVADPVILDGLSGSERVGWLAKPFSHRALTCRLRELLDA